MPGHAGREAHAAARGLPHGQLQSVHDAVLEDVPRGACPEGGEHGVRVVDVGEDQHRDGLRRGSEAPGRLDPVDARQADVHDDQVG